ncbi:MAG: 2-C-methyl-D-erythritol 4-phosphate cytidylyltransferase [Lachnospiraceae bacterium]|nr:2-C-methyl-D-erythritol 4-phosphate cytidylyltransferase [Lachnospiraceae bacterium]
MTGAIILSGGTGSRMGSDIPKQYMEAGGKPVISYCIEAFEASGVIGPVAVVAAEAYRDLIRSLFSDKKEDVIFAEPGANRQLSILSGLNVLKGILKDDDGVIIHDAARPLVSVDMIRGISDALSIYKAILPALPLKDTVYEIENGRIVNNLDRSRIVAGQAPEGFRFGSYLKANEALLPERILDVSGSMQPAVMAGIEVTCIQGDERNFKITTPEDLVRFENILKETRDI